MNNDKTHGGALPCERQVPLFVLGNSFSHSAEAQPQQVELCGTLASLLGLSHSLPSCDALLAAPRTTESDSQAPEPLVFQQGGRDD